MQRDGESGDASAHTDLAYVGDITCLSNDVTFVTGALTISVLAG